MMSASQRRPVYPGGQVQRKPPTRSTQVPLCRHWGCRSRGRPGPQSSSLISQSTPGKGKIGKQSGADRDRASRPVPQPWPWHTQRPSGAGAEISGHKVNAEAPMLAGLGGTLIHVILTVVTSIASWTLWWGQDGDPLSPKGHTLHMKTQRILSQKDTRQPSNTQRHAQ